MLQSKTLMTKKKDPAALRRRGPKPNLPESVLGAYVRKLRYARAWEVKDLALAVGCSVAWVHAIEKGKRIPSLPTLASIAEAFDVTTAHMLQAVTNEELLARTASAKPWHKTRTKKKKR